MGSQHFKKKIQKEKKSKQVSLVLYVTPVYESSVNSFSLTKIPQNFNTEGSDQIALPLKMCEFSIVYILSTHRINFYLKAEIETSASSFPRASVFFPGGILPQ